MERRNRPLGAQMAGLCWLGVWCFAALELVQHSSALLVHLPGLQKQGRQLQGDDFMRTIDFDLIQLLVVPAALLLGVAVLIIYYLCCIKPTAHQYIRRNQAIPDDLKGSWKVHEFGCCAMPGMCLCALFCSPCAAADLWYRAGWVHAVLNVDSPDSVFSCAYCCPGWQWCVAVGGYLFAQSVLSCCFPCLMAALRGGISVFGGGNQMDGVKPFREMFELPIKGFNTFCTDCCCYCWCLPCVMTQEYYQVMEVLKRPVVIQEAIGAQTPAVVGSPVIVVGNPVI